MNAEPTFNSRQIEMESPLKPLLLWALRRTCLCQEAGFQ
jgi:hypothetical protein